LLRLEEIFRDIPWPDEVHLTIAADGGRWKALGDLLRQEYVIMAGGELDSLAPFWLVLQL
jgi:hypothetical protein